MQTIDGIDYVEHGDVVLMRAHRGGGYRDADESIHIGGSWVERLGVVVVRQAAFTLWGRTYGNPDGDVLTEMSDGTKRASECWVYFFDGDMQATNTRRDHEGFPDGVKTWARTASPDELAWAEKPGPHSRYSDPA